MRLIDKDDLLRDMKKCKAYGELSAKSAIRKVETWQTVEAIPIEWIKEWVERDENYWDYQYLTDVLLKDWEKENERQTDMAE